MKLPAFQFYPGDWMKDPDLRRCSQAARGVWVDMLCLMFECEQRGVLATGGSPWSREDAAAAVGGNTDVTLRCIDELVAKGVCKVREDGALYSKRQQKDEETRVSTRDRVAKFRNKQECNGDGNGLVTPVKHPSSSSISSSTTVTKPPTPLRGGEVEKSLVQLRAESIFKRRASTPWGRHEMTAWSKGKAVVESTPEDDWKLLERFYSAKEDTENPLWRRKDLATLINNWAGEIDKARKWADVQMDPRFTFDQS